MFHCGDIRKIQSKYNSSYFVGQLNYGIGYYYCYEDYQFMKNIVHYLRLKLNMALINSNEINDTSTFGLQMVIQNRYNYLINYHNVVQWHPNLTQITTDGFHGINFLVRKETIKLTLESYLSVFNSSI